MKYFMDTHDRTKGSFPTAELTEEQFLAQFDALEKAAHDLDVFGHAAHVSLREGKAFCFMSGPDEEAIRKAHLAIDFPFDSITEVRRVTGADMRPSGVARATRPRGVHVGSIRHRGLRGVAWPPMRGLGSTKAQPGVSNRQPRRASNDGNERFDGRGGDRRPARVANGRRWYCGE
jgi:hypothetical protein